MTTTRVSRRGFNTSVVFSAASQITSGFANASVIDQNPVRRRGVGLRGVDTRLASPGYTLFAPMTGDGAVYLIDLKGNIVHRWQMPYPPGLYGYLTTRGTLFYNGRIPNDTFIGRSPFRGGAALEADWNGNILWEVRDPHHHHDGRMLKNGNVLLLCAAELADGIVRKIRGGRFGSEINGKMWADFLMEVTTAGETVWEWRTWDHLDPVEYPIAAAANTRAEWSHGNAIVELPDGCLLVSFRNISTVLKLDRNSGRVLWKLGPPVLSGQHAPEPLPNGNILIFDNGPERSDQPFPFSRVIEVNPLNNEILWKYQEAVTDNFYSSRISNAQRLPNGNTLINEGVFGRFFEVTPAGEVVWEYVNPWFGPMNRQSARQTNSVFRAYRYSAEEVARVRKK